MPNALFCRLPEPCSKVAGGELVPAELDANPKGGIDRGLAAESALRVLASGAEGGAADVLAAAALICPNRLLVGIPNAGAVNGLAAAADWLNDLLDGIPKAGAANKLPAVLVCPNKPPGCRPSDDAVVLAAVFAGAPAVMDARLYDGRACEVDEADAEDWKRLAVADAAGNPPGCGGLCRHGKNISADLTRCIGAKTPLQTSQNLVGPKKLCRHHSCASSASGRTHALQVLVAMCGDMKVKEEDEDADANVCDDNDNHVEG